VSAYQAARDAYHMGRDFAATVAESANAAHTVAVGCHTLHTLRYWTTEAAAMAAYHKPGKTERRWQMVEILNECF